MKQNNTMFSKTQLLPHFPFPGLETLSNKQIYFKIDAIFYVDFTLLCMFIPFHSSLFLTAYLYKGAQYLFQLF